MKLLQTLLLLLLALSAVTAAHAGFPDRPIKIIVGFPAGGPLDAHGRLLADSCRPPWASRSRPVRAARWAPSSSPNRPRTATR